MCSPATCAVCGKTTWQGCGQHVESVRKRVPAAQWCGGGHSESEIAAVPARQGFFARLFGR